VAISFVFESQKSLIEEWTSEFKVTPPPSSDAAECKIATLPPKIDGSLLAVPLTAAEESKRSALARDATRTSAAAVEAAQPARVIEDARAEPAAPSKKRRRKSDVAKGAAPMDLAADPLLDPPPSVETSGSQVPPPAGADGSGAYSDASAWAWGQSSHPAAQCWGGGGYGGWGGWGGWGQQTAWPWGGGSWPAVGSNTPFGGPIFVALVPVAVPYPPPAPTLRRRARSKSEKKPPA
jgi:hypothetical protein